MKATDTTQKNYMLRLARATGRSPNTSSCNLAAMPDVAVRAEVKAVQTLLEAMKRRLRVLRAEIQRRDVAQEPRRNRWVAS